MTNIDHISKDALKRYSIGSVPVLEITAKRRRRIEEEMMLSLRQKQADWQAATEETHEVARQGFVKALLIFNAFLLDGELPEGCET